MKFMKNELKIKRYKEFLNRFQFLDNGFFLGKIIEKKTYFRAG